MSSLSRIEKEETGLISMMTMSANSVATQGGETDGVGAECLDFAPGELWRRMEVGMSSIEIKDVIGEGS